MTNLYIFDLEGTISNHKHRLHLLPDKSIKTKEKHNYDAFHAKFPEDEVHEYIKEMMRALWNASGNIIILTGMMEKHRSMAETWLDYNEIYRSHMIMRSNDDLTASPIYKMREINKIINDSNYKNVIVFDDRDDVVDHLNGQAIVKLNQTTLIKAFKVN